MMTPPDRLLLTYADMTGWLRDHGAVLERTRGTHQQWRLPGGARVTVPTDAGAAGRKAWGRHLALRRHHQVMRNLGLKLPKTGT